MICKLHQEGKEGIGAIQILQWTPPPLIFHWGQGALFGEKIRLLASPKPIKNEAFYPDALELLGDMSGLLRGWQMAIRTSAIRTSRAASGSTSGLTSGRDMVAVSGKTKRAVTRSTPLVSPSKYSKGDIVGEINKK